MQAKEYKHKNVVITSNLLKPKNFFNEFTEYENPARRAWFITYTKLNINTGADDIFNNGWKHQQNSDVVENNSAE